MQYVLVLDINDALVDSDDSIEVAARTVSEIIDHDPLHGWGSSVAAGLISVRPLSEILAC